MTDATALLRSCTGVVLCGGASSRMGIDKASLLVEGEPLAIRPVGALLRAGVSEAITVGGSIDLEPQGVTRVADRWPGTGPLGGIASAAMRRPGRPLVVLACDLPAITERTITELAHAAASQDGDATAAVVSAVGGTPQWLVAILPSVAVERCVDAFHRGIRAPRLAYGSLTFVEAAVPAELVDVDDLEALQVWCSGEMDPE
ncbi:MAG: molybdenum cofactor guanylyltransferase [Actinomycetes bacterium]